MKQILFFVCLVFLVLLYSCTKCTEKKDYLSNQQLTFANFKVGSYWIMKDSITGVLDSFVLHSIDRRMINAEKIAKCQNSYEMLSFKIEEYSVTTNTKNDSLYWNMSFYGTGTQVLTANRDNIHTYFSDVFTMNEYVTNYVINGQIHDTVYVGAEKIFYYNAKEKILKLKIFNVATWELVRNKIVL